MDYLVKGKQALKFIIFKYPKTDQKYDSHATQNPPKPRPFHNGISIAYQNQRRPIKWMGKH